jgi:hypothetical protein
VWSCGSRYLLPCQVPLLCRFKEHVFHKCLDRHWRALTGEADVVDNSACVELIQISLLALLVQQYKY